MKGISEIISIILILMIVIAMSALAYTWFSGVFSDLTNAAGVAVTKTSSNMAVRIKVENALYNSTANILNVSVRNTGTQGFNATRTLFFVSDLTGSASSISCLSCDCNNLGAGCVATFSITSVSTTFGPITSGTTVKASIETGLTDSKGITIIS